MAFGVGEPSVPYSSVGCIHRGSDDFGASLHGEFVMVVDVADPQGYLGRSFRGHDNAQVGETNARRMPSASKSVAHSSTSAQ